MALGLGLDSNNDIIMSGTQFTRTTSLDHVAQKIRSRLQMIQGENEDDPTAGIPYFTEVFVKPVDVQAVASLFKSEIIETTGVNSLLTFDFDLDTSTREFTLDFSVDTVYGELDVTSLTINI